LLSSFNCPNLGDEKTKFKTLMYKTMNKHDHTCISEEKENESRHIGAILWSSLSPED